MCYSRPSPATATLPLLVCYCPPDPSTAPLAPLLLP